MFNAKPRKSLEKIGMLAPLDAQKAADFLRENPFLDKRAIGEYLGQSTEFSKRALQRFVASFEMAGLSFDHALRMVLDPRK